MQKLKLFVGGALLFSSSFVFSASQGAANGKPFQELAAKIEANQDLIEANQQDIESLELGLAALSSVVTSIDLRLSDAASQVLLNTADLEGAMERIASAEGDISVLSDELRALAELHYTDVATMTATIAQIELELAELAALSANLANELSAQIANTRGAIDANSGDIAALSLNLILVSGELASINSNYNVLQSSQAALESSLNNLTDMLSVFNDALMSLENRMTVLEEDQVFCGNPGGGSLVADNGTGASGSYCYNAEDTVQVRAQKACESHFGVGECAVITGGYQNQQYGQAGQGGYGESIHWHWDNHPNGHCGPDYVVGDVVSRGWCGAVQGSFLN